MFHRYRRILTATLLLFMGVAPALAQGVAEYPARPIKLIVPFPPGGGGDSQARLTMTRVARELGQPLVVENVPGAGGNIGAAQAARAPTDGYTLFYGTNGTHGINQSLYKDPGFDARKDFEPISLLTRVGAILVVRPGLEATSVRDLLGLMRKQPGKLTFASAGNGTTSHLSGEILKSLANVDAMHVPYRGGAQAMTDLLAGRVDFMIDVAPNVAPQLAGGRIKALAVSTSSRLESFPSLPTIAESGVPDFDVSAWGAVFAPAGTPRTVIDKINAAVRRALADPELRTALASSSSEPAPTSPAELRSFVNAEITRWGAAVKRSGASVN